MSESSDYIREEQRNKKFIGDGAKVLFPFTYSSPILNTHSRALKSILTS